MVKKNIFIKELLITFVYTKLFKKTSYNKTKYFKLQKSSIKII